MSGAARPRSAADRDRDEEGHDAVKAEFLTMPADRRIVF
jgi:hypothetical protein